jgi:hypothetical protein
VKASVEQNCVTVMKQIQLSSHRCFIPLQTALLDGVMCVFRAQNKKEMIYIYCLWLSVHAEFGTGHEKRFEAVRCVWTCLVKFKVTKSVSGIDVEILYKYPATLGQQQSHRWFILYQKRYLTV